MGSDTLLKVNGLAANRRCREIELLNDDRWQFWKLSKLSECVTIIIYPRLLRRIDKQSIEFFPLLAGKRAKSSLFFPSFHLSKMPPLAQSNIICHFRNF